MGSKIAKPSGFFPVSRQVVNGWELGGSNKTTKKNHLSIGDQMN